MSHHFVPEFTVLPTGKDPVSKKLQRNNEKSGSAKRRETEQLDLDNKQLEWKLSQLRQVMSKEKEDRGRQGNIWKSGSARIESHSRNILGRTVSGSSNGSNRRKISPKSTTKSPSKVKVLRDEPLDLPQRDSLSKDLMRRINSDPPSSEEPRRNVDSVRQLEHWIKFSIDKESQDVFDLQSDFQGNLKLSTVQAMHPGAIGVYFMKWGRKRLLIAAEGVIRKPKTGWGDDIYYPYTAKSQTNVLMRPEPPLRNILNKPLDTSPQPPKNSEKGGLLLQGSFDEAKNAASFQQAVLDWRSGISSEESSPSKITEQSLQNRTKVVPEMSVHVAQCTPEPFEVKFSETSTLSYMEHVLLQKHRQSDVPSLPRSLTDTLNGYLDPSLSKENINSECVFTTEEKNERERYRQIFSPQKDDVILNGGVKFEEVDFDDVVDTTDACIVEESPPPTPPPSSARSSVTVKIEEVTYGDDSLNQSEIGHHPALSSRELAIDKNNIGVLPDKLRFTGVSNNKNADSRFSTVNSTDILGSGEVLFNKSVHRENKMSPHTSIVFEIGKLPINPDAIYRKGLEEYFVKSNADHKKPSESELHDFEGQHTVSKVFDVWNPLLSIPSELEDSQIEIESGAMGSLTERLVESDCTTNEQHLPSMNKGHYDITSDSDDSADERALDDLEWELASQMGNITSDGRISRLIDEWPEEGDLDIIDDPGSGSGLSTPNVNSNRASRICNADEIDSKMQYDFHNMEHIVMDDLSDEYMGDEV